MSRLGDQIQRGVSAIEYAILAALIGIVIITAVTALGGSLSSVFGDVSTAVAGTSRTDEPVTEGQCNDAGGWWRLMTAGEIYQDANQVQHTADRDGYFCDHIF